MSNNREDQLRKALGYRPKRVEENIPEPKTRRPEDNIPNTKRRGPEYNISDYREDYSEDDGYFQEPPKRKADPPSRLNREFKEEDYKEPDYDQEYEDEEARYHGWTRLHPFRRQNWYFSLGRWGWGFWVLVVGFAAFCITQFIIRPNWG